MSSIIAVANELQEKDELIDQLTAQRDSFKACYEISYKEVQRLQNNIDRLRRDYHKIQQELFIANAALRKSNFITGNAVATLDRKEPEEKFPRVVMAGPNYT